LCLSAHSDRNARTWLGRNDGAEGFAFVGAAAAHEELRVFEPGVQNEVTDAELVTERPVGELFAAIRTINAVHNDHTQLHTTANQPHSTATSALLQSITTTVLFSAPGGGKWRTKML